MCDFSLEMYRSRPARAGERYETQRFPSGSIGLISPGDANTAVCLACDSRLRLENIPKEIQSRLGISEAADVTFVRLDGGSYHDAVRFANGTVATLQQLGVGVWISLIDEMQPHIEFKETQKTVAAF
jgi:hypothetical protein